MLLESAEDIGHLSVRFCPGRAPADHDPPTDVGGRKPNLKAITHRASYRARILLLRALCSTSAKPSTSSTGGT